MTDSYRALCTDSYVNLKLALKMELPRDRDRVLDLFDRVRRTYPSMDQFRRYRDELALETGADALTSRWLGIRTTSIRAGCVNPDTFTEGYAMHRLVLEVSPYFLSISPLDVDYVEVLYGFDLAAPGGHDAIVYDALVADSPLAALVDEHLAEVVDCQPILGATLADGSGVEAQFEVKTRSRGRGRITSSETGGEPISVYLTLRRYGPASDIGDLPAMLGALTDRGESLVEGRVVPGLLVPIRDAIMAGGR